MTAPISLKEAISLKWWSSSQIKSESGQTLNSEKNKMTLSIFTPAHCRRLLTTLRQSRKCSTNWRKAWRWTTTSTSVGRSRTSLWWADSWLTPSISTTISIMSSQLRSLSKTLICSMPSAWISLKRTIRSARALLCSLSVKPSLFHIKTTLGGRSSRLTNKQLWVQIDFQRSGNTDENK